MKQCPSALASDNWLLHGMDPKVGEHLTSCSSCAAAVAERDNDMQEFRRSHMTGLITRVERASHMAPPSRLKSWRLLWIAGPTLAATAALATPLVFKASNALQPKSVGDAGRHYVGVKGSPHLDVMVKRSGDVFLLKDGQALAALDQLALVPRGLPEGYRFFSVGTLSTEGYVPLYPRNLEDPLPQLPGQNLPLPGSVTIDSVPGPERLFVAFTQSALSGGWVAALAKSTSQPGLHFVEHEKEQVYVGWILFAKK